ncbi:MAG TPA: hypothetical protein VKA28_02215 [Candidatus Bathyarchaeia archaeon]|nr:hypothetical protein [Candidatus Bathyarchaeia archaeon]
MSNPVAFHGKTAWITAFIIALVFLIPVLAISLPSVTLPGTRAIDVTSLKTPTYAESSRATILNENNWTIWSLTAQQYGATITYSSDGLTLTGNFPASTQPLALSIDRTLTVNLTAYPIMYMLIKVSPSISYGIRFYSQSSGSTVPLWAESDALSHREGTGQAENVQVNMFQLLESNTGKVYDSTSSVTIYVERSASTQATHFSLQIKKLEFLNFPLLSAPASGSYHAIYVGLGQIKENPSFTLTSVEIRGSINASNGMVFVPYFIDGLSVYQGPVYTLSTIPIDLSVTVAITAQSAKSFSDNLPTEKAAIVLVAASGTFTRVSVESISLNYYSKTAQTSSIPFQGRNGYLTNAFFFLLLPVSVIVLLYGQVRRAKHIANSQSSVSRSDVDP